MVLGHVTRTLRQSKYIVHLSLDQSKQSDSPIGKITPAVLFPLMPNGHLLVKKFGNAKRLCLFYLMRQKRCWNYFAFSQ